MESRKTCRTKSNLRWMVSNGDGIQVGREIVVRWEITEMNAVAELETREA
jgi:hypothetical protein